MGKFVFKPQKQKIVVAAAASHPIQRKIISLATHHHATLSCAHTRSSYLSTLDFQWWRERDAIYSSRAHTPYCIMCVNESVFGVYLAFVPLKTIFRVHAPPVGYLRYSLFENEII